MREQEIQAETHQMGVVAMNEDVTVGVCSGVGPEVEIAVIESCGPISVEGKLGATSKKQAELRPKTRSCCRWDP